MVGGVDTGSSNVNSYVSNTQAAAQDAVNNAASTNSQQNATNVSDTYESGKNDNNKKATYSANSEKNATIAKLKQESDARIQSFKSLVEKLVLKQSQTYDDLFGNVFGGASNITNLKDRILSLPVDDATRAAAQEAISEDGEFGVKKTAGRILDFAKALIGDDMSKFDKIKDAVIKGFSAAETVWGGELPDISQKTYDAVMSQFDEWEKNGTTRDVSSDIIQQATVATVANN